MRHGVIWQDSTNLLYLDLLAHHEFNRAGSYSVRSRGGGFTRVTREVSVTNANKSERLWEDANWLTLHGWVKRVTGSTKTLVPAAVAGLVPRDRGAESELSRGLYKLNKFFTILGKPVDSSRQWLSYSESCRILRRSRSHPEVDTAGH